MNECGGWRANYSNNLLRCISLNYKKYADCPFGKASERR